MLDAPVGSLSGGEQARAQIARLVLRPADVLLLDEPTNDLDITTLELLEESLDDFPGALMLVTHDRYLLERICTQVIGLHDGEAVVYADYAQWERERKARLEPRVRPAPSATRPQTPARKKKLGYLEQREFDGLEEKILEAEASAELLEKQLADPAVAADSFRVQETWTELEKQKETIERLYSRWAELDDKRDD